MAENPLFTDDNASDRAYVNVRAASNRYLKAAREHCEALWEVFEPYADPEFRVEFRAHFDARYWEMYLTVYFVGEGYEVSCPKPGPDVGIMADGRRIWFEATAPTRGAPGAPDQVPELLQGQAQDVPEERIILRYLNSISEKYERQYAGWLAQGFVSADDAFVIAVNPRGLGFEYADSEPPRILQAAFTVGRPYIVINRDTLEAVRSGYHFRDAIAKASGAQVPTGVFQREDYAALSGLLCSRMDAANPVKWPGADFQLVPNPHARVLLPEGFRLAGTYYNVTQAKDGYDVTPEESEQDGEQTPVPA